MQSLLAAIKHEDRMNSQDDLVIGHGKPCQTSPGFDAVAARNSAQLEAMTSDVMTSPALVSIPGLPCMQPTAIPGLPAIREPRLSLGRVVHYVLPSDSPQRGAHRAATVSLAYNDVVANLTVNKAQPDDFVSLHSREYPAQKIPTTGCCAGYDCGSPVALVTNVCYDPDKRPGTWHWPERE